MSILHKLISLFPNKEKVDKPTVCCAGCKHLFYWCDGSVGCDIEQEYECIPKGFLYRESKKSCINCKNYAVRFNWCSKLENYYKDYSKAENCKFFDSY